MKVNSLNLRLLSIYCASTPLYALRINRILPTVQTSKISPLPLVSAEDKGLRFACSSPLLSDPPSYSSSPPPPPPKLFSLQHRALCLHSADCVSKCQVSVLPTFPFYPVKLQGSRDFLFCSSPYPHPFQSAWHTMLLGNICSPTGYQDMNISSEVTVPTSGRAS